MSSCRVSYLGHFGVPILHLLLRLLRSALEHGYGTVNILGVQLPFLVEEQVALAIESRVLADEGPELNDELLYGKS